MLTSPDTTIKPGTKLFQITTSPRDAAAALAGTSIVGNIAAAAGHILAHCKARQSSAQQRATAPEPRPVHPITAAFLFSMLNRLMPRNAVIAEECPSSKGDLDNYLVLDEPGSFYSVPNGVLGFGLPAAVGLQMAHPDRRVVCPIGDGSIQYSIQALWTAVQQNAPVIVIVLRNSDYSALKGFCDFTQVGRNIPGMDIPGIDIVKNCPGLRHDCAGSGSPRRTGISLETGIRPARALFDQRQCRKGGQKCMGMDQSVHPPNYR